MRYRSLIFATLLIVPLPGCVYRMDVPQGNAVETARLEQIRIGMTRKQVRFLIGEAAIQDPWHPDVDDYIHYLYNGKSGRTEKRHMRLRYKDDRLVSIEGSLTEDAVSN